MLPSNDLLQKLARRHVVNGREVRVKRCPLVFDHKLAKEPRTIVAIANTANVDLDSEVVVPSGADTSYFRANKTIFWNHDYDTPVASLQGDKLQLVGGRWVVHMTFATTPFAKEVQQLVEDGVVTGTSVGFIPVDYGRPTPEEAKSYGSHCESVVRTWKWLELSITPLPCNAEAVIQQEAKARLRPESCKRVLAEIRPKKRMLLLMS